MMSTILAMDYFGPWQNHPDVTDEVRSNAEELLLRVNALLEDAFRDGIDLSLNKQTDSYVSGTQYGGFRPQSCPIGAPKSAHKTGQAVDIYDPWDALDEWIDKHPACLETHDLYREASSATRKWCHLSTRAPGSKKRTFLP